MEWIGILTTFSILFLLYLTIRASYRKGYRAGYNQGATQVINEWKQTLETEGDDIID